MSFVMVASGKSSPNGNHFDASDGHTSLCINVTKPDYQKPDFHRKRTGLGHIAFRVGSADMVEAFVNDFLKPRQIEPLYGGAKAYPDYTPDLLRRLFRRSGQN